MRTLLEQLRIIIIFLLLGGLGWAIIENIYTISEATEGYSWLSALAILVLLFVLYITIFWLVSGGWSKDIAEKCVHYINLHFNNTVNCTIYFRFTIKLTGAYFEQGKVLYS
ncbi:hypothetical protein ACTWP4_03925 [Gracilibacillus sp. D59]|uniref:hypothetical protein n=1 Tax=Gracilibacillus sp. D59 TaxID=3457434 RepID=UPI003FCC6A76